MDGLSHCQYLIDQCLQVLLARIAYKYLVIPIAVVTLIDEFKSTHDFALYLGVKFEGDFALPDELPVNRFQLLQRELE